MTNEELSQLLFKKDVTVTQVFDESKWALLFHWYEGWGFKHKGTDFGATYIPVYFVINSKVIFTGFDKYGWGNYIIAQRENGYKDYYAHLNRIDVTIGSIVSEGDRVGITGNTGMSSAPHFHIGTLDNAGVWIDTASSLEIDWLTNFLKENNMTLPEFLNEMKKEFVTKDHRFKQSKDGRVWIVSDAKKLKYNVEKEIALPMSKLVSGWLSDEQFSYKTVTNQKEVL